MRRRLTILAALMIVGAPMFANGADILAPGDSIIAFDFDTLPAGVFSSYPAGEEPYNIADDDFTTKYLNFGDGNGEGTGFFAAPSNAAGGAVVQSIQFTTANDAEERDPASYEVYGTNDAISSLDNSDGLAENWTLITSGTLALPATRDTKEPVIPFTNSASYTGYKVVFPTVKNPGTANSMQIADVLLRTTADDTGTPVFGFFDDVRASGVLAPEQGESSYPAGEAPSFAIDGDLLTKHLNFGRENSGLIVTPAAGASMINEFEMWTANDEELRDPANYEIYGTNDPITSVDNGTGSEESWTLIDSGTLGLPADRNLVVGDNFSSGPVTVDNPNGDIYTSYRFVVASVKGDSTTANSVQYSELQLRGDIITPVNSCDFNNDQNCDCADIDALIAEIAAGTNNTAFDLTGDGVVNLDDRDEWLIQGGASSLATGGNPFLLGDADLSGSVDVSDFNIWNNNKFSSTGAWCLGDFNGDGSTDVSDFNIWNTFKFQNSDSVAAVPEPQGLGLALFGLLTTLHFVRKRR